MDVDAGLTSGYTSLLMRLPADLSIDAVAATRWFTTQDAAKLLRVSLSAMISYFDRGIVHGHRTGGGHRRISRESLLAYASERGIDVPGLTRLNRRILIVDDEPQIRDVLKRGLDAKGLPIEVETAASAEEAIKMLADGIFDLVVLDWVFPTHMQGPQVLTWIQQNIRARGLPVLGISGKLPDEGGENWFLKAGAVGFLPKPVRIDQLKDAIWPLLFEETRGKGKSKRPEVGKRKRIEGKNRGRRRA